MNNWNKGVLGDFITLQRGFDLPEYERHTGNVPVVTSSGISDFHNEAKVKAPGVVMGRYGTIGAIYFVEEDYWPHNTTLWIKDFKGNYQRFIYYFLKTLDYQAHNDKSSVPGVNRNHLHLIPVNIPPLPEQRAIAGILGALDDKIELNHRMNRTLESMARAVFRQWFVENDEANDWEEKALEDVTIKITKGTTPTTLGYRFTESGINFIKVNSITDDHKFLPESFDFIDEETNTLLSRSIIEKDDVLLTIAGTIGRVAKVPDYILPANTNQAVAIIRPDKSQVLPNYIRMWLCLDNVRNELFANVVHAVQANLSLGMISKTIIRLPDFKRLKELFEPIEVMLSKIEQNEKESRTLASLRDSLLPKLMRGEVRVKDVEEIS